MFSIYYKSSNGKEKCVTAKTECGAIHMAWAMYFESDYKDVEIIDRGDVRAYHIYYKEVLGVPYHIIDCFWLAKKFQIGNNEDINAAIGIMSAMRLTENLHVI